MRQRFPHYAMAAAGVGLVAWITSSFLSVLGLASSVLLFLLPVLAAAARGGMGAAVFAALLGGLAYNYFLLPPRFTLGIHGPDNVISLCVLLAVALVTSRLATRLRTREAEAMRQAARSGEAAELSAVLSGPSSQGKLQLGIAFLRARWGPLHLIDDSADPGEAEGFSILDRAAAAWALNNRDMTGHATGIMAAADWTFIPLAPRGLRPGPVAALARPEDGRIRTRDELEHIDRMCRLLGQVRDGEALESARRATEMLEARDALRRALLASLAHDVRTPLTVILGQMEGPARESTAAREALDAARRLNRTLTDLLGIARLEQGALAPVIEKLDLVDAVAAACDERLGRAEVAVARNIPADLPFVAADSVLLHHVLVNLFDNALRHARHTVTWDAWHDGDTVRLGISDDGPGMPDGDPHPALDRFQRLAGSDRAHGSGLGLAIVKGFADAMAIGVTAETAPSGGARFTLAIPCASEPER